MRIVFDGALTCTGGAQKRAGGAVSAKYSVFSFFCQVAAVNVEI